MSYNFVVKGMNGTIEAKNVNYEYGNKNYKSTEFKITLPTIWFSQYFYDILFFK